MKIFRSTVSVIFITLAVTLGACGSPATPAVSTPAAMPQTTLTIAGSGGAATVLKYLAEAYHQQNARIEFEFLSGSSSGGGVKGVLDSTLDLGTMSRPPKSSEREDGIEYLAFATDRIVIVTSSDMSITELTSQQARDIFLGNITNWSSVGGPNVPINILVRDEDESSTQVLRANLLGDASFASGSVVFTSDGELRDALSKLTNTIAFIGYSGVRLNNLDAHTLVIDGRDPADLGSDYPYFRPLGVAYIPANMAKAQSFLDFLVSQEAQALLAEQGINSPEPE